MKFKVLLRKRGGARAARAAAGAESGAANKMTSESFASSVYSRLYSTEPGREVSSPSRANEWRGPGRAHAFAWEAGRGAATRRRAAERSAQSWHASRPSLADSGQTFPPCVLVCPESLKPARTGELICVARIK